MLNFEKYVKYYVCYYISYLSFEWSVELGKLLLYRDNNTDIKLQRKIVLIHKCP